MGVNHSVAKDELNEFIEENIHELNNGDTLQIKGTENKFIMVDGILEKVRKDSIHTDPAPYEESELTVQAVRNLIGKLDNDLKYAEDRVELVRSLIDENEWIYDLLSTKRIILKEHKNKSDFLAEDQSLDKIFDIFNTYITFCKFKNEEDEKYYNRKLVEKGLAEKKPLKQRDHDKINGILDYITSLPHKSIVTDLKKKSHRELFSDEICEEDLSLLAGNEEESYRRKQVLHNKKREKITNEYWDKMFKDRRVAIPFYDDWYKEEYKSVPAVKFRKQVMSQMESDIRKLKGILGLGIKDKEERDKHVSNLIKDWDDKGKDVGISGLKQYAIARKMYASLVSQYEETKMILAKEFGFNISKHETRYEINSDTYYYDEEGGLVEVSKGIVNLNNPDTYKGLLLNYKELRDKYSDKPNSDWWGLIRTFEDLLSKTKLSNKEKFVLKALFDNLTDNEIRELLEIEGYDITRQSVNNMILKTIPKKIWNTYLDSLDEWLYTYKIKGEYKKCSKCGEVKLVSNNRYFGKDIRNKDGFKSICRECDNYTK